MDNVVNDDCFDVVFPHTDLFIVDPPYGGIINDSYDSIEGKDLEAYLIKLCKYLSNFCEMGTTLYIFGGVGTYRNRPFFGFLNRVEFETEWRIHNFITWKKRRGYGTPYNYIFTREEIAMLVFGKGHPKVFNIPYLKEERSDEWKKRLEKCSYKPKSDRMRRSNVFVDVNELFRNKLCQAEKPESLMKILIETSSRPGQMVSDPMCGSGVVGVVSRALNRKFFLCESDRCMYKVAMKRIYGTLAELH